MAVYSPSMLPDITSVEVVRTRGEDWFQFIHANVGTGVQVDGLTVQKIVQLWKDLPPGESLKCHFPPYGLRFLVSENVVCLASICWHCNNIQGTAGGDLFSRFFDANSPAAQTLLDLMKQIAGE